MTRSPVIKQKIILGYVTGLFSLIDCLMLTAASCASVLSTDADSPPVTETTVSADLLETFDIVTELGVNVLGKDLRVLSRLEILLPIQEPKWDLELTGVLDDGNKLLDLISGELSSSLIDINFGLFAN